MNLDNLRAFTTLAEDLHFGRAARRLDMLPASLGRAIRQLEAELGARLFHRTTRSTTISAEGAAILDEARGLLAAADRLTMRFRNEGRSHARSLRVGAIDTAAAGLLPAVLQDFRRAHKDVDIKLIEDKTVRLLPRLLSGAIDCAFIRPPAHIDRRIEIERLFHETPVIAIPAGHRLAHRRSLTIRALVGEPLIVPDRRVRPHSHDLTIKLFGEAGLPPTIGQIADEKQTILNLVAAKIGLAIIPRAAARQTMPGVRYVRLTDALPAKLDILPLAVAWQRGTRDPQRDALLATLRQNLARYARRA